MPDLLLSLAVGAGLIVALNLALIRFTRTNAKLAAAVTALITVGLYVPYSIIRWPGGDIFAMHLAIYLLASLACGMLLSVRSSGQGLHWGPTALSGFFIVVVIIGAVFVTVAERGLTSSWGRWLLPDSERGPVSSMFPGVISHNYHQKEELYNDYLQQVEWQRQRGWQVQKGWLIDPVANQPAIFRVAVQTRDGEPLTEATVVGQFLRSSSSKLDVEFNLSERAPGRYETDVKLPLPGAWNLVLQIRKGDDFHEIRANTTVGDVKSP
ncbi:MAG: FixH family protein [Candidatus Competibacteraceae bacterium]